MKTIRLRKPFFPEKSINKIQKDFVKTIKTGKLTLGENLKSFEKDFAKFVGVKFACGVSSATAGLHISLLSLGIGKGDEVIVPSKTFISTANSALYCNAKPIFCDVQEDTFQLDPVKLKKLITKKTKAIIPVHLGGNMCQMNEISDITKSHNISIVEDAAHAHGATYYGKKAGSFGLTGVFSFYPDKIMSSADGGIITTNNSEVYEKILRLRNVGRKDLGKYDYEIIGYNYRMNEIQAILLKEQLKLLPKMLKRRREIAKMYDDELKGVRNIIAQKIYPHIKSSYYAYIVRSTKGNLNKHRNELSVNGIETSPMFTTIYNMKAYRNLFGNCNNFCPISEKLDKQTFTIPLHPKLTNKEVGFVITNIKKTFN